MRYFLLIFIFFLWWCAFSWFSSDHDDGSGIFESSLSGLVSGISSGWLARIDAVVDFDSPRTAFYFSFPRETALDQTGITIIWHTESGDIKRSLDLDGLDMHGIDTRIFSIPWITTGKRSVSYSIISDHPLDTSTMSLITSYSESDVRRDISTVHASSRIISRAEWWADESYRYADSPYQKKSFQEYLNYRQSPKTQAQLDTIASGSLRSWEIERLFPTTKKTIFLERNDEGHRLVWSMERTEAVDRIVIHHTAENIEAIEASDAVYLRDIYKYHAITRGWGDIGYNYIIWQRWALYEWRAGGDYVVGGHTPGNNEWSVGIALIGNFENIHLNRDQRTGLEDAITLFAEKYGITLTSQTTALNPCKYSLDCSHVETHPIIALSGHRDYNATACPGINIYTELTWLLSKLDQQRILRKNMETPHIDPYPADEILNKELKPQDNQRNQGNQGNPGITVLCTLVKKSPKSPIVKIKLSYSGSSIILEWATVSPPIARIGQRKIPSHQGYHTSISLAGKNQVVIQSWNRIYTGSSFSLEWVVVRIVSWSRIPPWDTLGRYNDNLFRGKIVVRNDGGKLLVVNELPIEDYLKGMGEVSESVDVKNYPEKVKALIVAARSYGYYYMDKKLPLKDRKFQTFLYDISDNPDESQMYKWYSYEMRSPNYVKLVESTWGEVVQYRESVIKVWYSTSAWWRTLSVKEYCELKWNKNCVDIPYLQSVEDPGSVWKVRIWHWVGISWLWATYFATQGWDYKKIIQYYLKWVEISRK